jgi:hypothetical protein
MGELIRDLIAAIDASGAQARVRSELGLVVLEQLETRFAHQAPRGELWERLNDSAGHQNAEAWRWIASYLTGRPCILAFSPKDEVDAVELDDGSELVPVLEKCPGFAFYVTNASYSFLLCFNHHDFLIAAGEARDWLRGRVAAAGE